MTLRNLGATLRNSLLAAAALATAAVGAADQGGGDVPPALSFHAKKPAPLARDAVRRRAAPVGSPLAADWDGRGGTERATLDAEGTLKFEDGSATTLNGARGAAAYAIADADGDGVPEVLVWCATSPRLRAFATTGEPLYVADLPPAADFATLDDGDGFDDLLLRDAAGAETRLEAEARPFRTIETGAPIARFTSADWDRDGRFDLLVADPAGKLRILAPDGREIFAVDFGAKLDALLPLAVEEDPLALDVLGVAGGRVVRFDETRARLADAPCPGATSNFAAIDVDGKDPPELVATSTEGERTTIRVWRLDGTEIFRSDVGAKLRSFSTYSRPGDARRILLALPPRSTQFLLFDPRNGDGTRTLDVGAEVRSVARANVAGDSRAEFVCVLTAGFVRILDEDGATVRDVRPAVGRVSEFRVADLDGDDEGEFVLTLDDGVEVLGRDFARRALVRPPPRWRGASMQLVDLDGDGKRSFVFTKDEAPRGGPKRTLVAAFDRRGRFRFARAFEFARKTSFAGDFDADGATELAFVGEDRVLRTVDACGAVRWRLPLPADYESARSLDLDRDGTPEVVTQHPDGSLRLWAPPPRDRRVKATDLARTYAAAIARAAMSAASRP